MVKILTESGRACFWVVFGTNDVELLDDGEVVKRQKLAKSKIENAN